MDKKKIFAIALFFIMGFFMFTNANPANETKKKIEEKNEPTTEETEEVNTTNEVEEENVTEEVTNIEPIVQQNINVAPTQDEITEDENNETTIEENDNQGATDNDIIDEENTKPTIKLNGGNIITRISDNFNYEELGATASDNEDGDISNDIIISGEVLNEKGVYTIYYDVIDSEGLAADTISRIVEVVDVTELENDIVSGKAIINLTNDKEISEELAVLINELKETISEANEIIEKENSTQETIDNKEKEIEELLEKIKNLEFVVKFNIDNELVKEFNVKFNESVSDEQINEINTIKDGYTFTGWDGNFQNVMKNEEVNGYNKIINYNITYIVDNSEIKKETFNVKNIKTLTNYEKQGYTCTPWMNNNDNITSTEGLYSDIIVYSNCNANTDTKYKVIVKKQNLNNLEYTSTEYELTGATDSVIDIETLKSTYLEDGFEYFNHTKNSSTILANESTVITLIYNRGLYKLSFVTTGSNVETQEFKYGKIVNLNEYTSSKLGYNFIGWSLNGNVTQEVTMDSSKEVSAKFEAIEYSINYDLNEGILENENPSKYTIEDEIIFNQPTKQGYNFIGWYLDNELLNTQVTSIEKGSIGDLSLKAVYEIKTFTVNFYNENQLVSTQIVNYNDSAIEPESPTKDNYTFTGWSTEFNNVKNNIDVYATYSANQTGIEVELKTNAQLQFQKGSNVNINDYINVYKVFADGSKELTTDYTTDLSTNDVVDHKSLNIAQESFTNNELTYSVINEQAFQTKFEVVYQPNNYRETKDSFCTYNCDSKQKTNAVGLQNSVLEIIEHYDELIEIKNVTATYENETKTLSITDDSVRWSHKTYSWYYNRAVLYNPVYIATLTETETYTDKVCKHHKKCYEEEKTREVTVDVMNKNKIINTVSIEYERSFGRYSKRYVVVFANTNGIFTAIDEYEI